MSISNFKRKWAIILNPKAGKGKASIKWELLQQHFETSNIVFKVFITTKGGDERLLTEKAYLEGYKNFIAIGGDGTASGVVNGMVNAAGAAIKTCRFSLFPIGTGNDWSRTWKISKKVDLWWENFQKDKSYQQNIGCIKVQDKNHYFINVAGMCFDAFVVKETRKSTVFKGSSLHYLWGMSMALFKYKLPTLEISCDGTVIYTGKCYTVNAGICKYSGGGMQIVPHAKPNSTEVAFTIAKRISKLGVLLNTPFFYTGNIGWHPKIHLFKGKTLKVKVLQGKLESEADGEYLGEGTVEINILPWPLHCV